MWSESTEKPTEGRCPPVGLFARKVSETLSSFNDPRLEDLRRCAIQVLGVVKSPAVVLQHVMTSEVAPIHRRAILRHTRFKKYEEPFTSLEPCGVLPQHHARPVRVLNERERAVAAVDTWAH